MRKTVVCGDGMTRTGAVIYIHPEHRFEVLEFEGRAGDWREAFFLPIPPDKLACSSNHHKTQFKSRYTAEQIRVLYEPISNREAASKLGRTVRSVYDARVFRGIRIDNTRE